MTDIIILAVILYEILTIIGILLSLLLLSVSYNLLHPSVETYAYHIS